MDSRSRTKLTLLASLLVFLRGLPASDSSVPPHEPMTHDFKHFVLVHGACHGAWSWYKLVPLLRSSGHNVSTIELAASGIDPRQVTDLRSISDYIEPLTGFLASRGPKEKVILVGHSLGGLAISQAMELFPNKISVAVFLTAYMPSPSLSISTVFQQQLSKQGPQLDNRLTFNKTSNDTILLFGPAYLKSYMYQLSPIQDWALATTLMRPVNLFKALQGSTELNLTSRNYGSVKRVFIISEKDLALEKYFQKWMIEKNPPTEVREVLGSDHLVMMSKPLELWASLLQIAKKYN